MNASVHHRPGFCYFVFTAGGWQKQVGFDAVLFGVEIPIAALLGLKRLVGAAFDDPAFFDHQDLFRAADRGQPVRNDEGGAAFH